MTAKAPSSHLQEIVSVLEQQEDLTAFLIQKVQAAQLHKNPRQAFRWRGWQSLIAAAGTPILGANRLTAYTRYGIFRSRLDCRNTQ